MKTNTVGMTLRAAVITSSLLASALVLAQPLPTVVVQPHAVDLTLPVEANVEAVTQTTLTAQVSGRVVEMRVDAGQAVKKGDVLLRIDAREAGEVVAGASAQLINAKANYERQVYLHRQNFISAAALDKAKADLDAAQATYGQAAVSQGHANVVAPFSGVVAQRLIEAGDTATPGRALLSLYDPAGLRVTASVPQYQLPKMRGVKEARVEFPELGLWVDASSVVLLPTADAATHVSQVRVGLPAQLKNVVPGLFARVYFVVGRAQRLTVPAAAVLRRGEVSAVYVQNAAGAAPAWSLRQLRLGEKMGAGEIEVLAGLSSGERVALDPVKAGIELRAAQSEAPAPSK